MSGALLSGNLHAMTADDVAEVASLEREVHAFPWSEVQFQDCLDAGYEAWVRWQAGQVVAYAVLMPVLDEVQLLDIGVAPAMQRQGMARGLLEALIPPLLRRGMVRMILEVRVSNQPALALYRRMGFQQIGLRKGYYPASLGREDALVMAKELLP